MVDKDELIKSYREGKTPRTVAEKITKHTGSGKGVSRNSPLRQVLYYRECPAKKRNK